MRQLAQDGYKTMDLTKAVALLAQGQIPAEKNVVITFDDGFRNFHDQAFPALQEYGFTAAVFLPTAFIADARRSFKGTECLTWDEVRELRKAGITFGSHTVNHPELTQLPLREIERELRESKCELEQQLGGPVTTFAYPYAFPQRDRRFVQSFRELLVQTGYSCCATTELGRVRTGDDPYRLKRLPANSLDDAALFRAKLEGGYDWLAAPQALFKKLKRAVRGSKKRPTAVECGT
jgi:peptidoglycan/xylan/chitin deacetylase (PgdA/CDA1 family)